MGLVRSILVLEDPLAGLGFGWVASYFVFSGSPIAAVALALFDSGSVDSTTASAMIVGSRMGGSLIVIFLGLLYALRGHRHRASLLTGLLALIVTGTIYAPAAPLGLLLLNGPLPQIKIGVGTGLGQLPAIDTLLGPPVALATAHLPQIAVFGLGLLATIASLSLIDRSLPELYLKDNVFAGTSRWLYRPSMSFLLGLGLTVLTMSVSVSMGLLIPLSVRGYVRRENLVPYIMGCNISTFVDTLLAGILLRNPAATDIVLVQVVSVLVVSLLILALVYQRYQQLVLQGALWMNEDARRLAGFLAGFLVLPILLILT